MTEKVVKMTDRESIADMIRAAHHRARAVDLFHFYRDRPTSARMEMADSLWESELRKRDAVTVKLRQELRALRRRIAGDA